MVDNQVPKHKFEDDLSKFKQEFFLPTGYLYFSSHQLGPMSKRVKEAMLKYMQDWEMHANAGWRYGKWLDLEDSIANKLAQVVRADP